MGREAEGESAAAWRHRFWEELPSGLVLELGAGAGINLPHYPDDAEVVGIDLSRGMLDEARGRAGRHSLLQADAQYLPFADGVFDAVVASFVLCGVPDPMLALAEARRVSRPNAKLLLVEHGRGSGILGPIMDALDPLVVRFSGGEHINGQQQAWVGAAGFRVTRVDSYAWGIVQLILSEM
jgi:ubiquinone/menaquinone biosynthesis C-methylase UbiE